MNAWDFLLALGFWQWCGVLMLAYSVVAIAEVLCSCATTAITTIVTRNSK